MHKTNRNYLIDRAKIYRKEAQRAIELFVSGEEYRAQLVEKTIIKSCCSELKNEKQNADTSDYYELLERMASFLNRQNTLFENLDWIRINCRVYIDSTNKR
ncbi:hypothetical protein [Liquorilactobacillus uvarum]|uniref:hypothetical protein n=1 Tax=Liquorilactobacillus uvarum TaxID=303240 RepID=UPI00070E0CA1|nr:hypothetical protein [Liquorilactobacillus uvarum]